MQRRADPAPVVRVDELTGALPLEVRVVQLVVLVEYVQILGQLFGRGKLIDVYVGTTWRTHLIVLGPSAHYYRQYLAIQRIHKELLSYVIPAIGVFECQVELVVVVEYIEAFVSGAPRTFVIATGAINVHLINRRRNIVDEIAI